ncbi:hypothetical protein AB0B97_23505 [Micromonospora sp. NPDC049004]|uniref:hypothetical protein n=1 Tax=Micromonospora sp. NPDC049004 TaxID=3154348 RepID=UPI0033CD09DB
MTGLLTQVVAQLNSAIEKLDALAVKAGRAQQDTAEAQGNLGRLGSGSENPKLGLAISQSRTALDKAGRLGLLTSNAAHHLANYVNVIAPGSVPARVDGDHGSPSGERVVAEAESRGSRAEAFLRRHVKKADETEGNLQDAEQATTAGLRELMHQIKGGPGGTATSTAAPKPAPPADRPQLEHPVSSVIMAAGAVAVGLKGLWNMTKKHRERKHRDDQS